jgi:hypothetical protein
MATKPRIHQIKALLKADPMALAFSTLLSRGTRSLKNSSKILRVLVKKF